MLTIRDLCVSFPSEDPRSSERDRVLHHVSFSMKEGEILGVVGESGSGKSILALTFMGLYKKGARVDGGSILLKGFELLDGSEAEEEKAAKRKCAMIFQEPQTALNPLMKIEKQLKEAYEEGSGGAALAEKNAVKIREKLTRALQDVGLSSEVLKQYPHELSGGQRQRICIAMAILLKPDLLIADEPTTALDTVVQLQILNLLQSLRKKYGMAILFISHDLSVIRHIADRVLVMKDGRIIEEGSVREVFEHPKEPYTRTLLQKVPELTLGYEEDEPPLIRMDKVSLGYPGKGRLFRKAAVRTVVRDVSLSIYPGEILGLIGESGSGKSTLARSLVGGSIVTGGQLYVEEDLRPQMVFQDPFLSLNPAHTVGFLLQETLLASGKKLSKEEKRQRIQRMLALTGLEEELMERKVAELSGGQRQRVSIGMALLYGSKLLIADEPVSALDVTVSGKILELLLHIHKETHLAILFISHDIRLVRAFCHKIAVIREGEIVEMGDAKKVLSNPENAYTRMLIEASLVEM